MWHPSKEDAVEMFARQFEARHRSGALSRARRTASVLKETSDHHGHAIWSDVVAAIERLRSEERVVARRQLEKTFW
ncbi:MAG TPA: hypothetical protein VFB45_19165 [Pseudolabrys sp.]|nr:hypothetical protein [Pseudolabrys sp.]